MRGLQEKYCKHQKRINMEDYIEQIPMWDLSQLKDLVYEIPSQQRGYKWTPSNVKELISDLWEFINAPSNKRVYCLQPLAVAPTPIRLSMATLHRQRSQHTFIMNQFIITRNIG